MNKDINYNTIIPPFKWFILENFPYIEDDFDALTNWQLFCKLGKEMNKVIAKINACGYQTEELTKAFNELYEYVDNFIKNLDVQEEVNNKLDEMVEDGTMAEIINQEVFDELNAKINALTSNVKYHFIKTGTNSGDCILLQLENKNILYDLSKTTTSGNIENYLTQLGVTHLDGIIISHFHYDHIGGSNAGGMQGLVLSNFIDETTEIYLPTTPDFSQFINDTSTPESDVVGRVQAMMTAFLNACSTKSLHVNYMSTGDTLTFDGTTLKFLNCSETQYENYYNVVQSFDEGLHYCTNYNNFSMVIMVENLNNTFLLTGDVEEKAEEVIAPLIDRKITLKKLSHHSLNHYSNSDFLIKTNAKINVYCNMADDTDNSGRYPDIASNLVQGNQLYSTEYNGTMTFSDNGYVIKADENLTQKIYDNASGVSGMKAIGIDDFKNLGVPSYFNKLNEGDDLNDMLTCGDYYCSNSTIAGNISNTPVVAPFKLTTEYLHDYNRKIQRVIRSAPFYQEFVRCYTADGWGEWQEMQTSEHLLATLSTATNLTTNDYTVIPFNTQSALTTNRLYLENNQVKTRYGAIYKVEGYAIINNVDVGDNINIAIFVNNNRIARFQVKANDTTTTVTIPPFLVALSTTDALDIRIYNQTKKSLSVTVNNSLIVTKV